MSLRTAGHGGRLVGIDRDADLIAAALSRAQGIEFLVGDAQRLPFADTEFDAISARYVLDHLADPGAAVSEAARVLKPHGRLARLANGAGHLSEFWHLVAESWAAANAPGSVDTSWLSPPPGVPLGTRFTALATERFENVDVKYLTRAVVLESADVAAALFDTHRLAYSDVDDEDWARAREAVAEPSAGLRDRYPLSVTLRLCVVMSTSPKTGAGAPRPTPNSSHRGA